jgi:hypothetical protein
MGAQAVVLDSRQSSQQPVLAGYVDSVELSHCTPFRCGRGRKVRRTRTRPCSSSGLLSQRKPCRHVGNRTDAFCLPADKRLQWSAGRQTGYFTGHRYGTRRECNRKATGPLPAPPGHCLRRGGAGGVFGWAEGPELHPGPTANGLPGLGSRRPVPLPKTAVPSNRHPEPPHGAPGRADRGRGRVTPGERLHPRPQPTPAGQARWNRVPGPTSSVHAPAIRLCRRPTDS